MRAELALVRASKYAGRKAAKGIRSNAESGPKGEAPTTATVRDATNWDKIVDGLGLPDLTHLGLRHTGATWMADAGISPHVLPEILGHASIEADSVAIEEAR